jgi:hypothetical protein
VSHAFPVRFLLDNRGGGEKRGRGRLRGRYSEDGVRKEAGFATSHGGYKGTSLDVRNERRFVDVVASRRVCGEKRRLDFWLHERTTRQASYHEYLRNGQEVIFGRGPRMMWVTVVCDKRTRGILLTRKIFRRRSGEESLNTHWKVDCKIECCAFPFIGLLARSLGVLLSTYTVSWPQDWPRVVTRDSSLVTVTHRAYTWNNVLSSFPICVLRTLIDLVDGHSVTTYQRKSSLPRVLSRLDTDRPQARRLSMPFGLPLLDQSTVRKNLGVMVRIRLRVAKHSGHRNSRMPAIKTRHY